MKRTTKISILSLVTMCFLGFLCSTLSGTALPPRKRLANRVFLNESGPDFPTSMSSFKQQKKAAWLAKNAPLSKVLLKKVKISQAVLQKKAADLKVFQCKLKEIEKLLERIKKSKIKRWRFRKILRAKMKARERARKR